VLQHCCFGDNVHPACKKPVQLIPKNSLPNKWKKKPTGHLSANPGSTGKKLLNGGGGYTDKQHSNQQI